MIIIIKTALAIFISFILTIIYSSIFIPILKKLKLNQEISRYLELHRSKSNTPTMGGIIFILSSITSVLLLTIMGKMNYTYNFAIAIMVFVSYGFLGLIDDVLKIKRHNNKGLSKDLKAALQIIIAVIFFYLFLKGDNEPLLWIHTLNIRININFLYGLFILLVLTSTSNAVNITDGLDGLATGTSIIVLFTLGIMTYLSGWLLGYEELSLFCFIIVGSLLGFLIFNIHPAKIFMGDTGSLALGGVIGAVSILIRRELLLILIGLVFVLETLSVILQLFSIKIFNKKIFPVAPIHHSFEKWGLNENTIVRLYYVSSLVAALLSLIIFTN